MHTYIPWKQLAFYFDFIVIYLLRLFLLFHCYLNSFSMRCLLAILCKVIVEFDTNKLSISIVRFIASNNFRKRTIENMFLLFHCRKYFQSIRWVYCRRRKRHFKTHWKQTMASVNEWMSQKNYTNYALLWNRRYKITHTHRVQ